MNACLIIQITKFPICQHQLRATSPYISLILELIQALPVTLHYLQPVVLLLKSISTFAGCIIRVLVTVAS